MVHAIFTLYRMALAIIRRGTQSALHILAKPDVFLLHFVTESNGALYALPHFAIRHVVEKSIQK